MSIRHIGAREIPAEYVPPAMAGETRPEAIEWLPMGMPRELSFSGTSFPAVVAALTETFGKPPWQLNRFQHEQILIGMVAAAGEGREPYQALLSALRKCENIEARLK